MDVTLSGLQSNECIGWFESDAFCSIVIDPITPISKPSVSCFDLLAG